MIHAQVKSMVTDRDTMGWGALGLVLAIFNMPDIALQAIVAVLFPMVGWTLLYFVKREIVYRFPPKDKEPGKILEKINKELE